MIGYRPAMPEQSLEQRFFAIRIIYLALVLTLGVYGFVAYQNVTRASPHALDPTLLYALIGVAVMEMVGLPFLRRMLLPPMAPPRSLDDKVAIEGAVANTAFAKYFTTNMITWAICESIAMYGLVLVFMSGDVRYYGPFACVALLNFLVYRPSLDDLQAVVRAAKSS